MSASSDDSRFQKVRALVSALQPLDDATIVAAIVELSAAEESNTEDLISSLQAAHSCWAAIVAQILAELQIRLSTGWEHPPFPRALKDFANENVRDGGAV